MRPLLHAHSYADLMACIKYHARKLPSFCYYPCWHAIPKSPGTSVIELGGHPCCDLNTSHLPTLCCLHWNTPGRTLSHTRPAPTLVQCAEHCKSEGCAGCECHLVDLGYGDSVTRWAQDLVKKHGTVDVLVNNAAVFGPSGEGQGPLQGASAPHPLRCAVPHPSPSLPWTTTMPCCACRILKAAARMLPGACREPARSL